MGEAGRRDRLVVVSLFWQWRTRTWQRWHEQQSELSEIVASQRCDRIRRTTSASYRWSRQGPGGRCAQSQFDTESGYHAPCASRTLTDRTASQHTLSRLCRTSVDSDTVSATIRNSTHVSADGHEHQRHNDWKRQERAEYGPRRVTFTDVLDLGYGRGDELVPTLQIEHVDVDLDRQSQDAD
jgi:hypothetical protein